MDDLPFNLLSSPIVLRWTGQVTDAIELKRSPEIPGEEFGQQPKIVVVEAPLMTVNNKDTTSGFPMPQHDPLVHFDTIEQWFISLRMFVEIPKECLLDYFWIFAFDIVVPKDKIEPTLVVELTQLPEDMTVCGSNICESAILKEFIIIPEFNTREPLFEVVL